MFRFQQGSPKRKLIPEFIYKMANQIKTLSTETNKELKMKPRVSKGIMEVSSRWKSKI